MINYFTKSCVYSQANFRLQKDIQLNRCDIKHIENMIDESLTNITEKLYNKHFPKTEQN